MVTTRSREKNPEQNSPGMNQVEVVIPLSTRITQKASSSTSTPRSTRSTPRSTPRGKSTKSMGSSASKPSQLRDRDRTILPSDALAAESYLNPADESVSIDRVPSQSPSRKPQEPTETTSIKNQKSTSRSNEADGDQSQLDNPNTTLPERPKEIIIGNTHKRFHSEEPNQSPTNDATLEVRHDSHPDQKQLSPDSRDEENSAPETVVVEPRKAKSRLLRTSERKRRRSHVGLDDVASINTPPKKLRTPALDTTSLPEPWSTPSNAGSADQDTIVVSGKQNELGALHTEPEDRISSHSDVAGAVFAHNISKVLAEAHDESSSTPIPVLLPQIVDNEPLAKTLVIEESATASSTATPQALNGFGMAIASTDEAEAEAESQTEAGSATLTINSYATVPEILPLQVTTPDQRLQQPSPSEPVGSVGPSLDWTSKPRAVSSRRKDCFPKSKSKTTTLQQYRQGLLGKHPRTTNWAPAGVRQARFVGA